MVKPEIRSASRQPSSRARMEMVATQGTYSVLTFMRPDQIVVYALVNTLYVPCVATISILARELGWRRALLISGFTMLLALLVGGAARGLFTIFGS